MPSKKSIHQKDFSKIIDKRLRNYKFRSSKPQVNEWKGSKVVNSVYDIEMQQKFRNVEERLTYRMEVWIDVCRIEVVKNGVTTNGAGKFHSAKRFKKNHKNVVTRVRSFSLGKTSSKSVDNLTFPIKIENSTERVYGNTMSAAYSANDIMDRKASDLVEYDIDRTPKKRFHIFNFLKKNKNLKNITEKKDSKYKSKNKRKRNDSDTSSIGTNNNPVYTQRIRPSLFNMQSVRDSLEIEIENKGYMERRNSGSSHVSSTQQETLFQIPPKDSFRKKHHIKPYNFYGLYYGFVL